MLLLIAKVLVSFFQSMELEISWAYSEFNDNKIKKFDDFFFTSNSKCTGKIQQTLIEKKHNYIKLIVEIGALSYLELCCKV